eukprot:GHUV01026186.1.p1 GENE.GHUV01026186.1~~GHUV01026186.1.p1  ORF type:complete len:306 (+),score=57.17 GHUV01026186.1:617-1534(+)
MDTVYKAFSLLYTQITSVARIITLLPRLVAANACKQSSLQPEAGCTYYEGKVMHVRRRPVENSFEYRVRMVLVDLQRPPEWFIQHQAAEHMTAAEAQQFAGTDGKVLLLANAVVAGYIQNPISVYYCYDVAGKLAKAISEVTNTPWGERVTFLFNPEGDESPKALHVSPFMDMNNTWHLKATAPGPGAPLNVSVLVSHPEYGKYFDAVLLLKECAADQQCPPEYAGFDSLLRCVLALMGLGPWYSEDCNNLAIALICTDALAPPRYARTRHWQCGHICVQICCNSHSNYQAVQQYNTPEYAGLVA